MNYEETVHFLEYGERGGSRLGLDKLKEVLIYLGSPEEKIPIIHVAGTNGKGSVSAYSAYILAASGKRVGLFTSPYVYDFRERVRVLDGHDLARAWETDVANTFIAKDALIHYVEVIIETISAMGIPDENHPNHFEMLTIIAFLYFAELNCDVIVLETGIGGQVDATNVIPAPIISVITTIGLDHVKRLGHTHMEIARDKSGIMKRGSKKFLLYNQRKANPDQALADLLHQFFIEKAAELQIPIQIMAEDEGKIIKRDLDGQVFEIKDLGVFRTTLLPVFEVENAALAVRVVQAFDPDISLENLQAGVLACYWPARIEKLSSHPLVFLDGGHNPQGALALRGSLNELVPDREEIHLSGMMRDKDQIKMFENVLQNGRVKRLYCTSPGGHRATLPQDLAMWAEAASLCLPQNKRPEIIVAEDFKAAIQEAYREAMEKDAVIVCWGSFYLAVDFRDTIVELNNQAAAQE